MEIAMTLTRNFWTCVHTYLFGTPGAVGTVLTYSSGFSYSSSGDGRQLNTVGSFTDTTGAQQTTVGGHAYLSGNEYLEANFLSLIAFKGTTSNHGTFFSLGSTHTDNDYGIDSPISDASIVVTGQNSPDGSVTFHLVVTANSDISISEICMLKNLVTMVKNGSLYTVLLGRASLDTPITLTNGQSKTFDITISLPKPTA